MSRRLAPVAAALALAALSAAPAQAQFGKLKKLQERVQQAKAAKDKLDSARAFVAAARGQGGDSTAAASALGLVGNLVGTNNGPAFSAATWPAFAKATRAELAAAKTNTPLDPAKNAAAHGMTVEQYAAMKLRLGMWAMAVKQGTPAPAPISAEESAFLQAHIGELAK